MTTRTLLIGLDGATFTILDPLMRDGVMPFLNEFVSSGLRAELTSIIPPLTPPGWTSMITGRSPGQHGVFDFFAKEAPDSQYFRFVNYNDINAETLWSIANRHHHRVTTLNFPLMFPPPKIDGNLVSGFIPWRQLRLGCSPRELYDRLRELPGFNPRELAMDMDLEAKAVEGCTPEEYESLIVLHVRREQNWLEVLRMLMRDDPSEFVAVVFDGVDKIQHLGWRYLTMGDEEEAQTPWAREIRAHCLDYYRQLDSLLAELVDLAGPDATVFMASDHGFGTQTQTFFVNRWLEQQGWLAWADQDAIDQMDTEELGIGQLARHVYMLDWEKTRAYAPSPGGNGIYIVTASDETPNGVPPEEYEAFRSELKAALLNVKDEQSGEPVVSQVWTREEAFDGPHLDVAPDLTLRLSDSGFVSIVRSDVALRRRTGPSQSDIVHAIGCHRPEGVFIARGPGIQQGVTLPALSILDVAPAILYALDLPIPANFEGRVPAEAWQPGVMEERPIRYESEAPAELPHESPTASGPALDKEGEQELMKRLRALGYIE